jgi:hypothetical protein
MWYDSAMTDNFFAGGVPQFGTAEYARKPGAEVCQSCGVAIPDRYYRVNGALSCPACAEQAQSRMPKDSHAAFVRGLLYGIGGAILGLILYAGFGIITGLVLGYVSLAVGWIVGKSIKKGSNGIGGVRYQVAAVILTYAAVSLSAIPMGLAQYLKGEKARRTAKANQIEAPSSDMGSAYDPADPIVAPPPPKRVSLGALAGRLLLLGLTSPFLDLNDSFHGIIGLIILAVGLRIAWQLTGETAAQVLGPFKSSPAPPAPLAAS